MKTFAMTIEPYHQDLTVHRCSFDALLRWKTRHHPKSTVLDGEDRDAQALSLMMGGKHVLWFSDSRMSATALRRNVVHEVTHLVSRIGELAGLRPTRDSEEAYAYLQEYLYYEVATRLGVA